MKIWAVLLIICVTMIAACSSEAVQPVVTNPATPIIFATDTIQPTIPATATWPATATKQATATRPATATKPVTATRPATATKPAVSTSTQDDLKDEWRSIFNGSQILFASCELMYETHVRYQRGEIDITRAKSDLAVEANFFSMIQREFVKWADPSAAVVPFKAKLERDMRTYIELWERLNRADAGAPEVTDPLFEICSSFSTTQDNIVASAMKAGLTNESADELASEIEELLNDLYSTVRAEN